MKDVSKDIEAEECYKKLIDDAPQDIEARNTYGCFLFHRGRPREAKREFEYVRSIEYDNHTAKKMLKKIAEMEEHQ